MSMHTVGDRQVMNVTCPKCRSRVAILVTSAMARDTVQCPTCQTPFTPTPSEVQRFISQLEPMGPDAVIPPRQPAGWWQRTLQRLRGTLVA